jgi:GNAT superfamily N-acetyltransferase
MKLYEVVNDKLFWVGYEKIKPILNDQFFLIAKAGYININAKNKYKSEQFRIEATTKNKTIVGWVNFKVTENSLEAIDLYVDVRYRRKGIATEMYKFAKELGNDIIPSKMQTALGKTFWSKGKNNEIKL